MEKEVRFRIDEELYYRYKLVCLQLKLSVPKQSCEKLTSHFIHVQEDNIERMQELEKLKGTK